MNDTERGIEGLQMPSPEEQDVARELRSLVEAIDDKDCPYLQRLAERAGKVLAGAGA